MSALFGLWSTSIASYKSASGNLAVFLVLTVYVWLSAAIFLVGVELDELARESDKAPSRRKRRSGARARLSRSRG